MNWFPILRNGWRKKLLASVFALLGVAFIFPLQTQAADWSISLFQAEILIHTDTSITVHETILANFTMAKHGIFRNIPSEYETDQGGSVSVPLQVDSVQRNGQNEPYTTSTIGHELQIKIGDAGVTISGSQKYEITYTAQAAVNFFEDHDELYWNVTGDNWEVPLEKVEAVARLDARVPKDELQVKCFTGNLGSTAQDCTATTEDSIATYATQNNFLTMVFGWPKNIVSKPDNYDALRSQGTTSSGWQSILSHPIVFWGLNLVLPLLAIGWLIRNWMVRGRDPKGQGTIIAQYDPPPGLTPGEMGTLFDEHANHRDVVATIVDLAVRGFLTITETKEKKILRDTTDYRLDKKPNAKAASLKPHEQDLMNSLFEDGDSVTLSSLKGSFAEDVKKVQSDLYAQVRDQGYFVSNPNTVRLGYLITGAAITALGFFAFGVGLFGIFIVGIAMLIIGPFMPQRTKKGAEALWHAKGFKLFLEKAEKYRLQWQEKEYIFEQYLPYAMAFGVAQQWSKTFEGIEQAAPNWYVGTPGSQFNSILLWSALNNFSTASIRSFAPPAASGRSGFGGGGFSGGGFGGGGGGSW